MKLSVFFVLVYALLLLFSFSQAQELNESNIVEHFYITFDKGGGIFTTPSGYGLYIPEAVITSGSTIEIKTISEPRIGTFIGCEDLICIGDLVGLRLEVEMLISSINCLECSVYVVFPLLKEIEDYDYASFNYYNLTNGITNSLTGAMAGTDDLLAPPVNSSKTYEIKFDFTNLNHPIVGDSVSTFVFQVIGRN